MGTEGAGASQGLQQASLPELNNPRPLPGFVYLFLVSS